MWITHLLARARARERRLRDNLTLGGRLRVAQPLLPALGPALFVVALVAPYRWLFFIAYTCTLLSLGAYMWVRAVGPAVTLRRHRRSEWAQVGDELAEQWQIENSARLPLLWLEIEDQSTLPGYSARRVAAAPPRDHTTWLTQTICTHRGVYTLGPLTARLGDPLGLFVYEWHNHDERQIVIYPPLARLPPLGVPQGQRGGLARADLLQQYATPSVGGLREYVPGDLLSHIHWPTFARHDRLMVKEFDQERAGAVWVAVDLHAGAYTPAPAPAADAPIPSTFSESAIYSGAAMVAQRSAVAAPAGSTTPDSALELAVVLACSLAAQALAEGRSVGLVADDGRRRLVLPGRGPRQLWRILSELVDVQASGDLPLGQLISQSSAAHASEIGGAGLVLVTPALDGAWIPALTNWRRGRPSGVLALLVAPGQAQTGPLAARLASSGIAAHTFEIGAALMLLNPPRSEATARISPLGRLVGP